MLFATVIGLGVFLLTNLSLLYAAHLLGRRFLAASPPAVRLVGMGVLYYAGVLVVLQALSPFHAITRAGVTSLCLLAALAVHAWLGRHRNLRADIEPLRAWIRDGLRSRWSCLIIICGFVALLSFIRALLRPPLAWDSLTYHLTNAALWVQKGTLFLFKAPDQIAENAHFPINGELLSCWFLLPFRCDLLANVVNFPIALLGGIACYAMARELGLSRKEASFAPALLCFSPMIYSEINTAYVDIATFAFFISASLFALRYLQRGYPGEGIVALASAGIMLGTKYIAVPAVGLIMIAALIKTVSLPRSFGRPKKLGLICAGLFIAFLLGGRQYLVNAFDALNPLYPFSVSVLGHEIFPGSDTLHEIKAWALQYEQWSRVAEFSIWEREYRKFLYYLITAGPKYLFFFILAVTGLFLKPRAIPMRLWYFLASLWIIPLILYYADTSADFVKKAVWIDTNTRFLSPFIALYTMQGLVFLQRLRPYFRGCDFFLSVLGVWDLFYSNAYNTWDVEVLYPFIILLVAAAMIMFGVLSPGFEAHVPGQKAFVNAGRLSGLRGAFTRTWCIYLLGFIMASGGLYLLQGYRDGSRYTYYRQQYDLHEFPRSLVNAWEFLDRPHRPKRIAMTVAWEPPGHTWFFYPLLGKWFQNEILYVSAKHKHDVPTWLERGRLRGNDQSIWLDNLRRDEVDYILVVSNMVNPYVMDRGKLFQETWPDELRWMQSRPAQFLPVFSDPCCKIFKYQG